MENKKSLSIVVPCHNEEAVLPISIPRLEKIIETELKTLISSYEIVLVNNGSTDSTLNVMIGLQNNNPCVKIVDLRKNYGYQGSISAGLLNSSEDIVVSIDSDLQDDPHKIKEMIEKHYEGFEMVLGVRKDRKKDSLMKRCSAEVYYWLLKKLGVKVVHNHGDFRLLSRDLIEELRHLPEKNRYLRAMIFELESKYACVYYSRTKREQGESKFNVKALFSLSIDGITSFSAAPMRFISFVGMLIFMISVTGLTFVLFRRFFYGVEVPGWAFISFSIMFFGGVQTLFLGVIGEYLSKIYLEVKGRPVFSVRKIYDSE